MKTKDPSVIEKSVTMDETKNHEEKKHELMNSWRITLAVLAIIDFFSHFPISSSISISNIRVITMLSNMQVKIKTILFRLITWLPKNIFLIALCVHAVYTSWNNTMGGGRKLITNTTNDNEKKNKKKWQTNSKVLLLFVMTLSLHLTILPLMTSTSLSRKKHPSQFHPIIPWIRNKTELYRFHNKAVPSKQTLSLSEAFVLEINAWFQSSALRSVRKRWNKTKMDVSKQLASFAMRNPFLFHFRLKKCMTLLKWLRFLFPLIGVGNKLLGHMKDLAKKRKQQQRAKQAKDQWICVLNSLKAEEKLEMWAIRLQSNFRAMRDRKELERLRAKSKARPKYKAMKWKDFMDIKKCQWKIYRKSLKKKNTKSSEKSKPNNTYHLDSEKIALLKEEIKKKEIMHRTHLFKPNTTFAVGWKALTVTCLIFELIQLLFSSSLEQIENRTIDKLISQASLCNTSSPSSQQVTQLATKLIIPVKNHFFKLVLQKDILSNSPQAICAAVPLWTRIISVFINIITRLMITIVRVVSFIDVFVTFFTGEIDERSGALVPKPFFTRWFIPGVGLQLLVNPTMKGFRFVIQQLYQFCCDVGASRVFHAAIAVHPFISIVFHELLFCIASFVNRQNLPSQHCFALILTTSFLLIFMYSLS